MASIRVCIHAEGSLPPAELSELADLGIHRHVDHLVLDGTVADQAALIGVLERLRRAGLRIRDVLPAPSESDDLMASLAIVGQVGGLLRALFTDAVVIERSRTTSVDLPLRRADDLFDALSRFGALGLELQSIHVRRSADPFPEE